MFFSDAIEELLLHCIVPNLAVNMSLCLRPCDAEG